jgi:hypothetical protein
MTESEWLACTDPQQILEFVRDRASDRKRRLFTCACCRRVWDALTDQRSRSAVEAAERYADGLAGREELAAQAEAAEAPASAVASARAREAVVSPVPHVTQAALAAAGERADATIWAAWATSEATRVPDQERRHQCALLRDLVNPFRPVTPEPAWSTPQVVALAQAAYEQRELPAGTLDTARLAVLADALEEAGCDQADLLAHLRGPGPHARGCWAVDLLLGRE